MNQKAQLHLDGKVYELPTVTGSEGEKAVDISTLRDMTGYITLDDGYANTGSCSSAVTFIDGEKGILRYRGIPIEELAVKSTFVETAYLLIYGKLPGRAEKTRFSDLLTENENLHEGMKYHFEGFPSSSSHPMAMLSAMINASSCFYPGLMGPPESERFDIQAARLISQVRTIAAFSYRKSRGLPFIYPKPSYKYTANFLHMMFSDPYDSYELKPEVVKALDLIFLLHADHEQNCSTATVRMVASSEANLFASAAAGVCALWGPLHGGANQAVITMLEEIHRRRRRRPEIHHGGQGQEQREAADGIRAPGLQELRSAGQDHQRGLRRAAAHAAPGGPVAGHRAEAGGGGAARFLFSGAQVVSQRGFLQRDHDAGDWDSHRDVHGDVCHRADAGMDRQFQGNAWTSAGSGFAGPGRSISGRRETHYVAPEDRR